MRIRDEAGELEPEFSMAPLIDVVFQMLIFFLVATSWSSREQQLDLELPSAQSASEKPGNVDEVVIDVLRDGSLAFGGRRIESAQLEPALAAAARENPRVAVMIRGDRLVHHEDVVRVLDACGLAGLTNLAVGTLDVR